MSQHHRDYEDFLRGALHGAVDSVEPAGDGLERIRARLATPHPLPVAWLMAACSWVARYARGGLDAVSAWLMAARAWVAGHARGGLDAVSAWLQTVPRALARPAGAGERPGAPERQRQLNRLGLVFTVAAVTLLMAVSVSALTPFGRHVLSQAGSALSSIGGGEPAGTGEPGAGGPGSGAAGAGGGATHGGQGSVQPAATCTPGASALAVPPAGTTPASPGSAASAPPVSTTPASQPAASTSPASPPAAGTSP